ncbi:MULTISPECIES: YtpR family tRNA-binding protein [Kandleria]|jgi:tRNA-binding protein|uniref:tRNA-binding domain-containing protein n=1 Tax=Kandleria vitulina DSM 20405 TaxID=1410657 RepID=A0A0R2HEP5_9FIRM|nr:MULTISPECIES: DUF4479 domain-containing protein [Kandleria]KRN51080.1 hypothetical protein IV49_GL001154 [Kandleria vitulina DSM 20405]MBP3276248.1 DUF4479 domain-containing protein [Kandleria sp.]MEE0989544.1 DUF4479 domain-containing protein [Kandleria vitulina]SDL52455.1 tRNA-binding protein [Kandleria vitulina]SEI76376.1 tRNA-binding protein [Kandleria vitulina]
MNLHAFYRKESVGDILLVRLFNEGTTVSYEKKDDLVILKDDEKVIGYNVLNASMHFDHLEEGKVKINEAFVERLNQYLSTYKEDSVSSDYDDHFVVGYITEVMMHPEAMNLHIAQVDLGDQEVQIVCGSRNLKEEKLAVVALPGAVMPDGTVIEASELMGVPSEGMLCSRKDLGLSDKTGLLYLDEDDYHEGDHYFEVMKG